MIEPSKQKELNKMFSIICTVGFVGLLATREILKPRTRVTPQYKQVSFALMPGDYKK